MTEKALIFAVLATALLFSCTSDISGDSPLSGSSSSALPSGNSSSSLSALPSSSSESPPPPPPPSSSSFVPPLSSSSSVPTPSSSSSVPLSPSSSSLSPSSSSVPGVVYGTPVTYKGETYPTVVIGTQTWFAKNLNYNASGSKCYDNLDSNCDIYGRLYDWSTAMSLPSSCNSTSCSGQIQSPNHRGICPSGWHIPSNDDWDKLFKYVDEQNGGEGDGTPYGSYTAGKHLKATSGWNSSGNGTDTHGFSALPGGNGFSDGSFYDVGYSGFWWSASEYSSNNAYRRYMYCNSEYAYWYYDDKSILFSVRCLQD